MEHANIKIQKDAYNRPVVGIVGGWNRNYGNNLTYLALYKTVKALGFPVLMIERPANAPQSPYAPPFEHFAQIPFSHDEIVSPLADLTAMKTLNDLCDVFLVGSDQLYHSGFYEAVGGSVSLSWVHSNKTMIAYAPSFGQDFFTGTEERRAEISFFLKRFDYFSVREQSGVELAKREFGVDAEQVLDPVFLCEYKEYERLCEKGMGRLPQKPYVGAYILDPDPMKNTIIQFVSDYGKLEIQVISDGERDFGENFQTLCKQWNLPILENATCEEFVANIMKCDFFVTDSFHGVCFALLFKKPFCVIVNKKRGETRFTSLLTMLGLGRRAVESVEDIQNDFRFWEPINYERIYETLGLEISRSHLWLKEALLSAGDMKKPLTAYDILDRRCDNIIRENGERSAVMDQRVEASELRLEESEKRIRAIEQWEESAKQRIAVSEERIGAAELRLETSESRIMAAEQRIDVSEQWIGTSEKRMGIAEQRLDVSESRIMTTEQRLDNAEQWIDIQENYIQAINQSIDARLTLLEQNLMASRQELIDIQGSLSFRIGRVITWLPRKIRNGVRYFESNGLKYTLRRIIKDKEKRG